LTRVEAEHGFGVRIEGPAPLEPIADLPGVAEFYSLFRRIEGDDFPSVVLADGGRVTWDWKYDGFPE
ncbi:hypothetical protein ABZ793_32010, partial [Micromonospora sp. NPDC047465]|uniref:hypothetical protein n=1 Tax=Micromonospora sp. NPDC047465 TaxID=3154813 RepID=UPI003410E159